MERPTVVHTAYSAQRVQGDTVYVKDYRERERAY